MRHCRLCSNFRPIVNHDDSTVCIIERVETRCACRRYSQLANNFYCLLAERQSSRAALNSWWPSFLMWGHINYGERSEFYWPHFDQSTPHECGPLLAPVAIFDLRQTREAERLASAAVAAAAARTTIMNAMRIADWGNGIEERVLC